MRRAERFCGRAEPFPGYTEVIGLDLGINGPEGGAASPDSQAKPNLKARSNGPGTVQVDFSKEKFDGVVVESRRAGEEQWQSLGVDSYSPYIDDRPPAEAGKPEARQYRRATSCAIRPRAIGRTS